MSELRLEAAPNATLEDEQQLKDALGEWNVQVTGLTDYSPVNFFLRDESGAIRGGVLAYVWGRWLHVGIVWLPEELRGQDWGTRMLEAGHNLGRDKGAVGATLSTFDWQARPFYERLGYKVVATLPVPEGHEKYYMVKAPL